MTVRRLFRWSTTRKTRAGVVAAALVGASATVLVTAGPAHAATTFSNTTAINVADANGGTGVPGTGSLYPSNIVVSGQSGTISHLTVTLNNVSHPFAGDFDVLLVGPNGAKFEVVSDAGGGSATSNVTATFDDAAASALASGGNWGAANSSVTVKPSNVDSGSADVFPSPAPAGPYLNPNNGVFLGVNSQSLDAAFGGLSPNGTWSLYVVDDTSGDTGSFAGGWAINVTVAAAATTTTTVTSSTNPSTTGSSVTFNAHVVDSTTSANVTAGTVTFKDGGIAGTTLASGVALNASGVASFSTSALGEGAHSITAIYSGTASFATSNGSVTQVVDNPTVQSGNTFSNNGAVTINDFNVSGGAGFPYPSHINVTGVSGAISNVTVALKNVSHPDIDDLDAMLVGPGGQKLIFLSDAGSASAATTNANVTLDDGAASLLPSSGPLTTGTFRPTDYNSGADTFPSPAPTGASAAAPQGAATLTSVFGGLSPNGQWSLYVVDDGAGGSGSIAGGWALTFTTSSDAATTTTVTSSQNPSTTGSSVTFTAHVTQQSNGSNVTVGTVTFRDGAAVIGAPVALNAGGTASVSTSALTEGSHTITASYSGSPGSFNLSTGTMTQQVDGATVVNGASYCNNGGLLIKSAVGSDLYGTASVYPSHIAVSGTSGNLTKLTVTIKGLTHAAPDDIDMLLVSPTGTTLELISDAGGLTAISGVNLTLDDAAASSLPDSTVLTTGTYKPTDYGTGDVFPTPAPSGPYGTPATAGTDTLASFTGGSANGTWSLYVVDDSAGLDGSITGWCLNLTLPPTANDDAYTAAQDTPLSVAAPGVLANDTGTPAPTAVAISGGATTQGGTVTLATNGGFTYTPPSGFTGTDTFTYTATNGPGSTDTATVTITVTHKPTITGAAVSRQQGSPAANDTIATVNDVETPAGNLTVTANPPAGITVANITNTAGNVTADVAATCAATTGPNSVPLTVTDGDSLTNTDNLTVNVSANTAPSLAYGSGAAVNAGGTTAVDPAGGPSDNGSIASLTVQNVPAAFTGIVTIDGPASATPGRVHVTGASPAGDYTITLRATDNCGLTTDATLGLEVNGAPTVDAGPDQTVTLVSGATLSGSVTDDGRLPGNLTPTTTWSQDSGPGTATFTDGSAVGTTVSFTTAGVYVLRLTADDGQLSAYDTVTITVSSPPTIHVPADITVTESSPGAGAPVTFTVTADGFPTPTIACVEGATPVSSGDTFAAGVHTIDCTATNAAGSDSGSFTITVRSGPVIHVPADITVTESTPGAGAPVTFTVTADGTPTPTIACFDGINPVQSGDTFAAGVHTITCTATNGVGSDSGSFTITVQSVPVITVPADITTTESSPGAGAPVTFTVTATGVPTPTIACVEGATPVSSGDTFAAGVHTIDCTATNAVGSDSGSFTITVRSVPVIHVPADITVTESTPGAGAPVTFTVTADGTPTPTIGCFDGINPVQSGDTFAAGVHTITCTATNGVGSDSGSFTITVQSVPVITVPADFTVTENPAGSGGAAATFTVTATGVPTPTIACVEGATPVSSGDTFAIGSHTITCTATNAVGSDSDSFIITVVPANHPPVPSVGGPYSVAEGASLTLDASGTTDADGDVLTYSWDVNGDGTFGDATGVNPTLTWSQLIALGINDGPASFSVKVRVSDGHVNGTVTSGAGSLTVTNTAPTGGISGSGDAVRGTPLSLSFTATDPSPVDQAAGFDFTIDWGDGTTTGPLHAGSPFAQSHTFSHVGVYSVSMVARDKDGGTSTPVTKTVTVSGAEVVAGACGGTDLVVGGTSGSDRMTFSPGKASGTVKVSLNNNSLGTFTITGRVVVLGEGGDDAISFDQKFTVARLVFGGAGNDTVSGSNGSGVILGGSGDDTLSSGNSRDIIVGGAGADSVTAGNGDDILVAGSTAFDEPTAASQRAWCAVQAEWTRTDASYATRIAHLSGTASGGLNGSTLLRASGGGRNVFDDGVADTLKGQLGSDWFLANVSGGVLDGTDAVAGEVQTDLS